MDNPGLPPAPQQQSTSFIKKEAVAQITLKLKQEEQIAHTDLVGLYDEANIIGAGAFGEVRKVSWRKTPAAAKIAKVDLSEAEKSLFLRELDVLTRCRHPNIVQFLGYVDQPFVIVMEWLPMGDLKQYWRARTITKGHKYQICIDVLRALAYLHNRKPAAIIHRDIKPTNVLMTKSGVAKLTDFGLGRFLSFETPDSSKHSGTAFYMGERSPMPRRRSQKTGSGTGGSPEIVRRANPTPHVSDESSSDDGDDNKAKKPADDGLRKTAIVGTAPYMAPEAVQDMYDEKLDIFSAAVTFYELFEQTPFDDTMPFAWAVAPTKARPIVRRMGAQDPKDRPSALELIDLFGELAPSSGKSTSCSIC